jgi:hypothetical protein
MLLRRHSKRRMRDMPVVPQHHAGIALPSVAASEAGFADVAQLDGTAMPLRWAEVSGQPLLAAHHKSHSIAWRQAL